MNDATVEMLAAAIEYAERGWRVFPVHGLRADGQCDCGSRSCQSIAKHPCIKSWTEEATIDACKIVDWWEQFTTANVGIVTGQASHIAVLDVDDSDALGGWSSETLTARTPRGFHFYYALNGVPAKNSAGKLGPKLDVRGEGGYVVAPPSIHATRAHYHWVNPGAPLETVPHWLLVSNPIPNGHRNDGLFKIAAAMRGRGQTEQAILDELLRVNEERCAPPLSQLEVLQIRDSVTRYQQKTAEQGGGSVGAVLRAVSDIQAQKVSWLWPGRIPLGKLSLFAGDPGLGKSLVTNDIAARTTRGSEWPDGATNDQPGSVIILSAEDDAADTIRPRLEAAGAVLSKVHILQAVRRAKPNGETTLDHFSLQTDLVALQDAVASLDDARLIVIDPISAYLGGIDSHKNAQVRALLAPLAGLASGLQTAIVAIDHLNKSMLPALYRPGGSIAFVAAARAVWLFAKNPDDAAQRLMLPGKLNLAPDQTGLGYSIKETNQGIAAVVWGETVNRSAETVLQPETAEAQSERSECEEAMDWLRERLSAGPVPQREIKKDALAEGLAWRTVRRAKQAIGVRAEKDSFKGGWYWHLPPARGASLREVVEGGQ